MLLVVNMDRARGRVIKKKSRLFDIIDVKDFSFVDIAKKESIFLDNNRGNIIHKRLHEHSEIDELVARYDLKRIASLNEESLKPVNFTKEWEQKQERASRSASYDDDEEYERFIEKLEQDNAKVSQQFDNGENEQKYDGEDEIENSDIDKQEPLKTQSENSFEREAQSSFVQEAPPPALKTHILTIHQQPVDDKVAEVPLSTLKPEEVQPLLTAEKIKEMDATQKKSLEHLAKSTELLKQAMIDVQSLKKKILENAEDNFISILKGIATALFDKALNQKPELLIALIKKVIAMQVKNDRVAVELHPETLQAIKQAVAEVGLELKENPNLGLYEFNILTDLGAIHSDMQSAIANLLEESNLKIFED
jgi:hypothetical protein